MNITYKATAEQSNREQQGETKGDFIMTQDLIARARGGDQSAKTELYEKYKPLVRSFANSFFLMGGEREDLLQEGMIGLFEAVDGYDGAKGTFSSFACLCIKRRIINAVNKANSAKNKPLLEAAALQENMVDESPDPLEAVIGKDSLKLVLAFIDENLTQTERIVVEYFCSGYSREEICHKLGKSYKSVDTALQRARRKLTEFNKADED